MLFTVGPLLLSVKGIFDLAQMPPTILLPHPGGTGTPTMERPTAYLPGPQPPFPPRAFNPASISPGEDPSLPPSLPPPVPTTSLPLSFLPRPPCFLTLGKSAALHRSDVSQIRVTELVPGTVTQTAVQVLHDCPFGSIYFLFLQADIEK